MTKPPIPDNEVERLAAVREYNIIDSLPEMDYDNLTRIAAEICQMPVSLITIMDAERQWFKSHHGTDLTENSRDLTFCAHGMINPEVPLIVPDATKDPRFSENPIVTGPFNIRFYSGISLINESGYVLGSLCVFDVKPNQITDTQLETLKALGNQVVQLLELRKTINDLKKVKNDLLRGNNNLKEFAYTISHDLKAPIRNLQQLSEIIYEDYADKIDKTGIDYLKMIKAHSIEAISLVDGVLSYSKSLQSLSDQKEVTDINELLLNLIEKLDCPKNISITVAEQLPTIATSKIAIQQIFSNLIGNAVKYNDKENGWIKINYKADEQYHVFTVADNGRGISPQHLESIFTLFYMIDPKDASKRGSSGVGLSIIKKLLDQLEGKINVKSTLGEGSVFEFSIKK